MNDQRLTCSRKISRVKFSSVIMVMLVVVSACVETELNSVPGLSMTMDESERRAVMRDLSVSISTIEDAGISGKNSDEQRSVIVSELNRIAALISQLESESLLEGTVRLDDNHEFIGQYLGTLASEVELAKGQAGDENSDLFIAGQLAGVCRGCHEKLWPGS